MPGGYVVRDAKTMEARAIDLIQSRRVPALADCRLEAICENLVVETNYFPRLYVTID
jgi:hypothetical protein